jgi:hypothetical protein
MQRGGKEAGLAGACRAYQGKRQVWHFKKRFWQRVVAVRATLCVNNLPMAFWSAACDGFLRYFASSQAIRFHVFSAIQAVVKQFAIIKVVEAEWAQYFWHVRFLSIFAKVVKSRSLPETTWRR